MCLTAIGVLLREPTGVISGNGEGKYLCRMLKMEGEWLLRLKS